MALTLTPDAEARLRTVARQRGSDPEETLLALLDQALSVVEEEILLTGLQRSAEDHDAGRSMTIEEYRLKALARRQDHGSSTVRPSGPAA